MLASQPETTFTLYRLYRTDLGRWLNRDPIGEWGGLNLYGYVGNNPINRIDPLGLWGIQFGNFNIGYGNPNLAFNNDSWMDLANGAAATADGLIPFGDPFADLYQNGDIWSDDNQGLSDYERGLYEKSKTGGKVAQVCLTTAAGLGATRALNGFFMPKTLYHFTSAEGAAGIATTGGIQAGSGIYGTGVYLTGFNSATMATIQGAASTEAVIAVSSQGLAISPTFFPGTYILRGASLLLP
jgi:hypothetical protein